MSDTHIFHSLVPGNQSTSEWSMASPVLGSDSFLSMAFLGLGSDISPVSFSTHCVYYKIMFTQVVYRGIGSLTSLDCGPVTLTTATPVAEILPL